MFKKNLLLFGIVSMLTLASVPSLQMSYAHQRALFTIGDKDYLFVLGSTDEPLFVDDKTSVEITAYWPDPSDPTNSQANGTKPIMGLEEMLKVDISAGANNMTSDLEPAYGEVGKYESQVFYPTVATTFDYRIFGNINGTDFDYTFTCNPAGGEAAAPDNSTVQISDNVVRKALIGGFGCPDERTGFPEPYISNFEISQKLNGSTTVTITTSEPEAPIQ